jgi:hypothetical protein
MQTKSHIVFLYNNSKWHNKIMMLSEILIKIKMINLLKDNYCVYDVHKKKINAVNNCPCISWINKTLCCLNLYYFWIHLSNDKIIEYINDIYTHRFSFSMYIYYSKRCITTDGLRISKLFFLHTTEKKKVHIRKWIIFMYDYWS